MGGKDMTLELARLGQQLNVGTPLCPVVGFLVSYGMSESAAVRVVLENVK